MAEQFGGGIDRRRIDAAPADKLYPVHGVAVPVERELRLGAVRRVVVDRQGHVPTEDRLEVEDIAHFVEAEESPVRLEWPRIALRMQHR